MHTTTPRLALRRFTADDGPALFDYLSRPDVVRFEPYGPLTRGEAIAEATRRAGDPRFVAVERSTDGILVGHVFRAPDGPPEWRTWTVGYVFHPEHGGQGYATEATRAVVDDCFRDQHAHRVTARCDPRNAPSWRLLERLGLRREAHELECASFESGPDEQPVWHDAYLYAVLDREWPAGRMPTG